MDSEEQPRWAAWRRVEPQEPPEAWRYVLWLTRHRDAYEAHHGRNAVRMDQDRFTRHLQQLPINVPA